MMMTNKGVHLVLLIVLVYAIHHETEALPHASLKSRVIELLTEISKLSRNQHHTRNREYLKHCCALFCLTFLMCAHVLQFLMNRKLHILIYCTCCMLL